MCKKLQAGVQHKHNQSAMEWRSCIRNAAPFAAMMAVECTDIGMSTVGKADMTKGMSNFVLVVYSNALGSIILLPFVLSRCPSVSDFRQRIVFTYYCQLMTCQ